MIKFKKIGKWVVAGIVATTFPIWVIPFMIGLAIYCSTKDAYLLMWGNGK